MNLPALPPESNASLGRELTVEHTGSLLSMGQRQRVVFQGWNPWPWAICALSAGPPQGLTVTAEQG